MQTGTSETQWRKSSYSGPNGGDCVEVADNSPSGTVPVRDSKNPTGPVVTVGAPAWRSFIEGLR
ncbi:DUF397 domain-containing protein [Streptomyces parvulus]|uniref:DUF397 domain-containing protein n=1 Tax=Streptomyces parvulus TaxID=146923 RepID=A0A369V920_9ACTN|nr:DUF397 domain-containing protein [Streptomyces parvulus]RDD89554.1 DUF397 domain-containing protein [Streptomyces parvulus]